MTKLLPWIQTNRHRQPENKLRQPLRQPTRRRKLTH